jgi:hypothetical protein
VKNMCFKKLDKVIKKLDHWDILCIKLASIFFALGVIKLWPAAMTCVHNTSIWWFAALFVIFAIRPGMKYFRK